MNVYVLHVSYIYSVKHTATGTQSTLMVTMSLTSPPIRLNTKKRAHLCVKNMCVLKLEILLIMW